MAERKETPQEKELVRILGKDISGNKTLLAGLTKIKGISWAFSNALCKKTKLDRKKRISEISTDDIKKIEEFIKNPGLPLFVLNRRKDFESGESQQLCGADLSLKNEFDIKRIKKIRSYRGSRHMAKLPVRGQRTKANFRPNRRKKGSSGIKKK